ncbi:MAG: corrinoid protein [Candidatus Tectomicrobia bacterium]|uniref:Corrinoid protein n=1 Tax=Tectimicrobiota bacterium TaxID=2528274 RepID=A0A932CLW6_UNCTE|nr:corrinoid protein [Candidatus Tectomicrobia bacterium]
MDQALEELREAILKGDGDLAQSAAQECLKRGLAPLQIIHEAVVPGIQQAGELWNQGEYFIPDIVMSAEAYKAAVALIEPHLKKGSLEAPGKVVLGVVAGDMHDLGKNLVVTMMQAGQLEVVDLGVNVPVGTFVQAVKEHRPQVLGLGAYMSTTMLSIRDVIAALKAEGLREGLKIMVGGVPVTEKFAHEVGADAHGRDAIDALEKARQFLG